MRGLLPNMSGDRSHLRPFINDVRDKLATIGIITSRIKDVLPFVVETATEMGMRVFDPGDSQVHRPKGWKAPIEWSLPSSTRVKPWWRFWENACGYAAQLGAQADFGPPLVTITSAFAAWAEAARVHRQRVSQS